MTLFDDPVPPCSECGEPREPCEAAAYGGKCEDCWASLFPTKVGATSGAHVGLRSEDSRGDRFGPKLWMW